MKASKIALALLAGSSALLPATLMAETDEILVTAQRRSERLVDVPATVSVFSGEQLQKSGIVGSLDLRTVTPGLNMSMFGPYVQPTIRGVGTTVLGAGADANVAIYVDGVYQSSQIANLFEFASVERIETLKGPQGSLYGRNATGGAIVVTTRAPSFDEISGTAEASYGSFNEARFKGYLNVPFSDKLAMNLAVNNRANDGYTDNVTLKMDSSITESFGARGKILFQPVENLSFTLAGTHIYQADNTNSSYSPYKGNSSNPASVAAGLGLTDRDSVALNQEPISKVELDALSLNIDWDLNWGSLTSITAWTKSDAPFNQDQDGTEIGVQSIHFQFVKQETISQELIYTSPQTGRLSWIGGLYYLSDEASNQYEVCVAGGGVCPKFLPLIAYAEQNTEAFAAYVDAVFDVTDTVHLTLGGRYSWEEKAAQYSPTKGGFLYLDAKDSWSAFTPRAALRFDLTDQSSAYISYAEGFKSGLFDSTEEGSCTGVPGPNCPFKGEPIDPESVRSYEVGYKYNSGNLVLSAAAFFSEYDDIQVTSRRNDAVGSILLQNAAAAEIYGAEFEVESDLSDRVSVHGGMAYTHSEYTDFKDASVFTPTGAGGNSSALKTVTGNQLIRSPEWTAFTTLNYLQPLQDAGAVETSLTVSYSDSFFWAPDNRLEQPAYTMVNGRISWIAPSENWRLSVFGNNLADEDILLYVRSSALGDLVSYQKPINWGVSLSVDF